MKHWGEKALSLAAAAAVGVMGLCAGEWLPVKAEPAAQPSTTYENSFDTADALADFDAYYIAPLSAGGVDDPNKDQWILDTANGLIKRSAYPDSNAWANVAALTLREYRFQNFEAEITYNDGSMWEWVMLAFRQTLPNTYGINDGAVAYLDTAGEAWVWGPEGKCGQLHNGRQIPGYVAADDHVLTIRVVGNEAKLSLNGTLVYTAPLKDAFYHDGFVSLQMGSNPGAAIKHFKITNLDAQGNPVPLYKAGPIGGEGNFVTNLGKLESLSGYWNIEDNGLRAQSYGDAFALSGVMADDFSYEGTVTLDNPTGAGGLLFRSNSQGKNGYVANVDLSLKKVRLFKFMNGVPTTLGEYALTGNALSYDLKAEARGADITVYVDGEPVITARDNSFTAGYFGLLNFATSAVYQDVTYTDVTVPSDPDYVRTEKYRPQFHYTPAKNWVNDPNGLVYNEETGEYHLFYQHNPYSIDWGNMSWGHAVSTDLIHWEEREVAMWPDEIGTIFSGCCVVDRDNTSGLFDDSTPPGSRLVALFTHSGNPGWPGEMQSLAYSKDGGDTWIKYGGNPIMPNTNNEISTGFRDPKVFWYEDDSYADGGVWVMLIAGGNARIYTSSDLIRWAYNSDVYYKDGATHIYSECTDLFPLPLDGDEENTKWVITGAGQFYVVGDLYRDGQGVFRFTTQTDSMPMNASPEIYATQSFYNDKLDRRILVSWLYENSAALFVDSGKMWNSTFTLPYEATLKTIGGQMMLCLNPVEELGLLENDTLFTGTGIRVTPADGNILEGVKGDKYRIQAVIDAGDAEEFGFLLRTGNGKQTKLYYDVYRQKLLIDRRDSGASIDAIVGSVPLANFDRQSRTGDLPAYLDGMTQKLDNGKLALDIVVDWSVIEAFGGEGESSIAVRYFPQPSSTGLAFYTAGGDVTIESLEVQNLASAWRDDTKTVEPGYMDLSLSAETPTAGKELIVAANILPQNTAPAEVTFTVEPADAAQVLRRDDGTVTLIPKTAGSFTVKARLGNLEASRTVEVVSDDFKTNLTQLTPSYGTWTITPEGYIGTAPGDSFLMSQNYFEGDMVLEADITPKEGGAPALVFCSQSGAPNQGSYVFNMIMGDKFRIFEFPTGQDLAGKTFAEAGIAPQYGQTYHVRIRMADGGITVHVNDVAIFENVKDTNAQYMFHGGYVGLMAWAGTFGFQNVYAYTWAGSPTGAVAVPEAEKITLSWNPPQNTGGGAVAYNVYRDGTLLNAVPLTGTRYEDTGLQAGQSYTYTVKTVNPMGESKEAASVTAAPLYQTFTVTSSAGQGGTISPSGAQTVNKGADVPFTITPEQGYRVDTLSVDGQPVDDVQAGAQTYTLENVQQDHVIAVSFTRLLQVPEAPGGLAARAAEDEVVLTWTAPDNDGGSAVTGYCVYRDGVKITDALVSGTSYTDDGLKPGTYVYTVRAVNEVGEGASSREASAVVAAPPEEITYSVTVQAGAGGTVTPSGTQTVKAGESLVLTIVPKEGYELKELKIDGRVLTAEQLEAVRKAGTYTLTAEADCVVQAAFAEKAVSVPTSDTSSTVPTSPVIPSTGDSAAGVVPAAGLILAVGCLVIAARKRRGVK